MSKILTPSKDRFVLFPIQHAELWKLYKQAQESLWVSEEIDLEIDVHEWNTKLTEAERSFIKKVLAFFANADGIVNENCVTKLYEEVQLAEARAFYSAQIFIEQVHAETYALLIDRLVSDASEKQQLFHAMDTIPAVEKKANWALKWMNSECSFGRRIISFACVEGIFFSGSFCAIYWLKKRGIMPGLCFSNELISRDEGLHCTFACKLYHMLDDSEKPDIEEVVEIIKEAVQCEDVFVRDALHIDLLGLNADSMITYIQFVADYVARQMGIAPIYGVKNPFDWMDLISLQGKSNFFEKRVPDYRRSMSKGGFSLDAEF